ncbi:MAG: hypothetical protein RLZZ210_469 [Pseudomonadota bacterium]|jgi:predicted GTPase
MPISSPINKLQRYTVWQDKLVSYLQNFEEWLKSVQILNKEHKLLIQQIYKHIKSDKINIACIAEFSRGKSELINALFFSDYQKRIIPTSSGRTTMCPTEVLYDEKEPISIKLLPIETHVHQASTEDFMEHQNLWHTILFDVNDDEALLQAFNHLKETIWVSEEEAILYGLYHPDDNQFHNINEEGLVEISKWRHAIINFPHPLLEQGLVVVDTPGLNAIGSEPELALRLIPEAHIVLFMLAADTGVTKTDLELWLSHVQPHQHNSALVVLNKIDTLLDPLKTAEEHQREIQKQMVQTAKYFGISPEQIYPISAKLGLLAKINQDIEAYHKSGLALLEEVLVTTLIPKRQSILLAKIEHLFVRLLKVSASHVSQEKQEVIEQLMELQSIEEKDTTHVNFTLKRLKIEKQDFNQLWINCQAMRSMFVKQSSGLLSMLEDNQINNYADNIRNKFEEHRSTSQLKQDVSELFAYVGNSLDMAYQQMQDIVKIAEDINNKLNTEAGAQLSTPAGFNIQDYQNNLHEINNIYNTQFGRFNFLQLDKAKLIQRFLDTVVARLRQLFMSLSKDVDAWIKDLITPSDIELKNQETKLRDMLLLVKNTSINPDGINYNKEQLQNKIKEYDKNLQHICNQEFELGELLQILSTTHEMMEDINMKISFSANSSILPATLSTITPTVFS